jgi:hypothetical protein
MRFVAGFVANKAGVYDQALRFLDETYKRDLEVPAIWVELSIAHENMGKMNLFLN